MRAGVEMRQHGAELLLARGPQQPEVGGDTPQLPRAKMQVRHPGAARTHPRQGQVLPAFDPGGEAPPPRVAGPRGAAARGWAAGRSARISDAWPTLNTLRALTSALGQRAMSSKSAAWAPLPSATDTNKAIGSVRDARAAIG